MRGLAALFKTGGGEVGEFGMSRVTFGSTRRLYGIELLKALNRSRSDNLLNPGRFEQVRLMCLFIGYARSGSSLVGSLIDAHPNAVISHELDALRFVRWALPRDLIFSLICGNSREFSAAGRRWTGYSYEVPASSQGRFERLLVIGDKKAAVTTLALVKRPTLIDRVQRTTGVPVRLVHVVRNPFDIIATRHRYQPQHSLEHLSDLVFELAEGVAAIEKRIGSERIHTLRLEALVGDPRSELERLCAFLGLEACDDYLGSASGIVQKTAHRSRTEVRWPGGLVASLQRRCEQVPFFSGYRLEGSCEKADA